MADELGARAPGSFGEAALCSPHIKSEAAEAAGLLQGERKSDSSLGVAAQGSKALPGSQGHEISSSEQAEANNSLPLQTCCSRRAKFCGLGCRRGGTLTLAWAEVLPGQAKSAKKAGAPQKLQLASYLQVPRSHVWGTGPGKLMVCGWGHG